MTEPEFPEDLAAYDSAGNFLGEVENPKPRPSELFKGSTLVPDDNRALDIKIVQKDRASTMPGYRLVTFDEMEVEPPANRQVELVIQGINLKDLTPDKQAQVLDLLAQLTGADRSQLQITKLEAGSVHVFVDLPRHAAYE